MSRTNATHTSPKPQDCFETDVRTAIGYYTDGWIDTDELESRLTTLGEREDARANPPQV